MRRIISGIELWEICLYLFVLLLCAPNTFASRPLERWFWYLCREVDIDCSSPIREPSAALAYWMGMLLMAGLLVMAVSRGEQWSKVKPLVNAITLLSLLFIADWFVSTEPFFRYTNKAWAPYAFATFFLLVLLADVRQAERVVVWLLVVASVESWYAVVAHLTGRPEFVTPHFGRRAGGSFLTAQPNILYPLSMMAVPIATTCALYQPGKVSKIFYSGCACINLAALVFTFSRAGWLGLSFSWLFLSWSERKRLRFGRFPLVLASMSVILILATIFVRTHGKPMGHEKDRAARGRVAIWKVALRSATAYPVLGSGIGTYSLRQSAHMTDELRQYGASAQEAKNLLLNILVETGLVGLLFWVNVWLRYVVLYRQYLHKNTSPHPIVIGANSSFIALHVAGLFDTPLLHVGRVPSTLFAFLLLGSLCSIFKEEVSKGEIAGEVQPEQHYTLRRLFNLSGIERAIKNGENAPHHQHALLRAGVMLLAICLLVAVPAASGLWRFARARGQIDAYRTRAPARPQFTPLAEIAEPMRYALIASEDGNFYQHHGVDWQALHRALRVNIRSLRFKQGGSTLTMQTARYLFVGREKTLSRKLAEILLALEMEKRLSKERILELYLNSARFGLGAEDIGTACRVYFGKKPGELTLAESAFLAGVLPEPPKRREELTAEKVERCKRRALSRLGYFFAWRYPPQKIERAMGEKIVFVWER